MTTEFDLTIEQDDAIPRKRSKIFMFLTKYSLDEIVENVRRNNPWETEEKLVGMENEIRITYNALELLVKEESPTVIASVLNLPISRLNNWMYLDCIPKNLSAHQKPLTPSTEQERISFAYLLGVYSSISGKSDFGKSSFAPKVNNSFSLRKALEMGRIFLVNELRVEGNRLRHSDGRLAKVLNHCLVEEFEMYVTTDHERVAYLQGMFDSLNPKIMHTKGSRGEELYYRINRQSKTFFDIFVKTLFELEVFPRLSEKNRQVYIEGYQNLKRFQELEIDGDSVNKTVILSFLLQPSGLSKSLETYYHARAEVRKRLMKGHTFSWENLSRRLDLSSPDTLKAWTLDLMPTPPKGRSLSKAAPHHVQRYEKLLAYFYLPNVFEEETAVTIGETCYFNVDGLVYRMPLDVRCTYCKLFPEQTLKDTLPILHRQLRENLNAEKRASLTMNIDDQRIIRSVDIRYPYRSSLALDTSHGTVVLTNKALFAYFTVYSLPLADLTSDDINFLRDQYELQEDSDGDLIFRTDGNLVTGISLKKTTTGGNRAAGMKEYVGVRLRESERGSFSLI